MNILVMANQGISRLLVDSFSLSFSYLTSKRNVDIIEKRQLFCNNWRWFILCACDALSIRDRTNRRGLLFFNSTPIHRHNTVNLYFSREK